MEILSDNDQKDAYISGDLQFQNHSVTFSHKNKSLLSATSVLPWSHMAYNTNASLDKLAFTDYVDFGNVTRNLIDFFSPFMIPIT